MKQLLILGVLIPGLAFATKPQPAPEPDNFTTNTTVGLTQHQNQVQGQEQVTTVTTGEVNVNLQETKQSSNLQIRNVPNVYAPAVYSANPCIVGGSAALSVAGFGASGGASKESWECRVWDSARILLGNGYMEMGLKTICLSDVAKKANFEYCNNYASPPEGWGPEEVVEEPKKDYSQFNQAK